MSISRKEFFAASPPPSDISGAIMECLRLHQDEAWTCFKIYYAIKDLSPAVGESIDQNKVQSALAELVRSGKVVAKTILPRRGDADTFYTLPKESG